MIGLVFYLHLWEIPFPHLTDPIAIGELTGVAVSAVSLPSPMRCPWEEINELLRLL